MKVGRDDKAKVYLNGALVYRTLDNELVSKVDHSWYAADQDVVAGLELRAGINVLILKVYNQAGTWQGSIRFTDESGEPLHGIEVTLSPPRPGRI